MHIKISNALAKIKASQVNMFDLERPFPNKTAVRRAGIKIRSDLMAATKMLDEIRSEVSSVVKVVSKEFDADKETAKEKEIRQLKERLSVLEGGVIWIG